MYKKIKKDKEKRIGWITFNKPATLNMCNMEDSQEFVPLLNQIEEDDDVKVLILKGAGDCFGSGWDIVGLGVDTIGFERDPSKPRPGVRKRLLMERGMFVDGKNRMGAMAVNNFCKPCISQVHGYCYGLHFQIAAMSDIVVCSEEALFTHPAFRYTVEGMNLGQWVDQMGIKKASEMMLTGGPITAQEMLNAGFVNRIVSKDKLESEVLEMASVIALMPIDTLVVAKHLLLSLRAVHNDSDLPHMIAPLAHCAWSFMKMEPNDFMVLRETVDKGASGAIQARERRYPPRYRLSYGGRAAKE